MDAYKFNRNFITVLKIFNKHPNMLLNFLSKNDTFTDAFKKKLSRAVLKNRPHFTDLESMIDYYVHLLDVQDIDTEDMSVIWNNKLYSAISEQRFEDAAGIRDYMNKKGYKILI